MYAYTHMKKYIISYAVQYLGNIHKQVKNRLTKVYICSGIVLGIKNSKYTSYVCIHYKLLYSNRFTSISWYYELHIKLCTSYHDY